MEALIERLDVPDEPSLPVSMLSWEEVRALAKLGFSIGAHTVSHPILSRIDSGRAWAEIVGSRDAIAAACGRAPRAFAYPNGGTEDYTEAVVGLVRRAGFTCAVTTRFGVNGRDVNPWELRRGGPWEYHLPTFAAKLAWYRIAAVCREDPAVRHVPTAPVTGTPSPGLPAEPSMRRGSAQVTLTRHLAELAEHAHLVLSFAKRDVRARYKQTVLGVAWAIVQPFALMVVFTLVFSRFAGVPSDGKPYPVFVYSALLFWTFFAMCVSQGTLAMAANSTLVRKIYFPRETLLLAVLLSARSGSRGQLDDLRAACCSTTRSQ